MMIVLALGKFGSSHSRVMTQVRRNGVVTRDELARLTGLSGSTVARTVTGLLDARLLRERPDRALDGTVGRPGIPLELDPDHHVAIGCYVGRRVATVSLSDLSGRVIARQTVPDPSSGPHRLAVTAAARVRGLLAKVPGRSLVGSGLVAPWGDIVHDPDELGDALTAALGVEVDTSELVPAIAATEYIGRPHDLPGSTMYLYARDTVGFVMANERPAGTEVARVGRLSHFPAGGLDQCRCGRTGCLETAASDESVAARALASGIVRSADIGSVLRAASSGKDAAHRLLCARAEALGRAAAIVRDITNPDRVVLCGQGFTGYPAALDVTRAAFAATTATRTPIDISFTRFVGDVQSVAAATVALRRLYDDPTAVVSERHPAGVGRGSRAG